MIRGLAARLSYSIAYFQQDGEAIADALDVARVHGILDYQRGNHHEPELFIGTPLIEHWRKGRQLAEHYLLLSSELAA